MLQLKLLKENFTLKFYKLSLNLHVILNKYNAIIRTRNH